MSIQANSQGVVTGKFTIPGGIPAGTKQVEFRGSGGSVGYGTFTGQGTLVESVQRQVTTTNVYRYDPLAETFTLPDTVQIAAVDLWFTAKGNTRVAVQVRETQNGFPTQRVLAEKRLSPADITTLTSYTRVAFPSPVTLLANVEYALVILCDDADTAVAVAELGKWDSNSGRWVTAQPYQVGVLLSSSNASTWTAHQDRDLTFRLHKAVFSEASKSVALGSVAVNAATDLMVLTADEIPSSVTRIEYELGLPGGRVITVSDSQPVRLDSPVTGNVTLTAKMYGNANFGPILFPGTQLVVGKVGASGDYVSRAIKGGANVRVKAVFEALIPAGAGVAVKYKGVDAGDAWASVPFVSSSPMDDNFQEMTHEVTGVNESMVQIKLELTGSTGARPRVRNLRFMTI